MNGLGSSLAQKLWSQQWASTSASTQKLPWPKPNCCPPLPLLNIALIGSNIHLIAAGANISLLFVPNWLVHPKKVVQGGRKLDYNIIYDLYTVPRTKKKTTCSFFSSSPLKNPLSHHVLVVSHGDSKLSRVLLASLLVAFSHGSHVKQKLCKTSAALLGIICAIEILAINGALGACGTQNFTASQQKNFSDSLAWQLYKSKRLSVIRVISISHMGQLYARSRMCHCNDSNRLIRTCHVTSDDEVRGTIVPEGSCWDARWPLVHMPHRLASELSISAHKIEVSMVWVFQALLNKSRRCFH